MTLLQAHETRLRIKKLTDSLPSLGLIERCEAEDEILELRKQIGEFTQSAQDNEDCEACGA